MKKIPTCSNKTFPARISNRPSFRLRRRRFIAFRSVHERTSIVFPDISPDGFRIDGGAAIQSASRPALRPLAKQAENGSLYHSSKAVRAEEMCFCAKEGLYISLFSSLFSPPVSDQMAFFASLEFLFLFSSSFGKREVGGEEERKKKEEKRHPKLMAADLGAGLFGALKRVTGPKSWVLLATAAG